MAELLARRNAMGETQLRSGPEFLSEPVHTCTVIAI